MFDGGIGIAFRRVDARSDRSAAEVDLPKQARKLLEPVDVFADRHGKGTEFRTQPHWHRIHQLRAAYLDDVVKLLRLVEK